jgi:hypothetical protein
MKRLIAIWCISFLGACGTTETRPTFEPDYRALEPFGISHVEIAGDRYILQGPSGDMVAEVRWTDSDMTASYRDQRAASHAENGAWSASCNGQPASAATPLRPCADAFEIASVLIRSRLGIAVTQPDHRASLAGDCIFVGTSQYCDGPTLVYEFVEWCEAGNVGGYARDNVCYFVNDPYCDGL